MSRIDRPPFTWQSGKIYNSNKAPINVADAFDAFTNLKTVEYTPIVEAKPLPYVDLVRNRLVPDTPANVSIETGELRIDGSTTKQTLYTRKHGRYLPGLIGFCGIGARLGTPDIGNYKLGYGNETNRLALEVDNGNWYLVIVSNGIEVQRKPRSEWLDPLDGTGPSGIDIDAIDKSKIIFRIYIGWYGYLPIKFNLIFGDKSVGGTEVNIDIAYNDRNGVSIAQPDLPVFAEVDGGVLYVGGRHYGVFGRYNPERRTTSLPAVTKTVPDTVWTPVASAKIKNLVNLVGTPVKLASIVALLDNDTEYAFFLHDISLLTGHNFINIPDTTGNGTVLEYDESATALAAGGYKMYGDLMGGGQGNTLTVSPQDLPNIEVTPDLVVTLAARSLQTSSVINTTVRFEEEW